MHDRGGYFALETRTQPPRAHLNDRLLAAAAERRPAWRQRQQTQPQLTRQVPASCTHARQWQHSRALAASGRPDDAESIIPVPTAAAAHASPETHAALFIGCMAMAMAAVHRAAFSVLSVPIQLELGLSLPQMGTLQSALLAGYLVGQVHGRAVAGQL